jgi:hypothetical protein
MHVAIREVWYIRISSLQEVYMLTFQPSSCLRLWGLHKLRIEILKRPKFSHLQISTDLSHMHD